MEEKVFYENGNVKVTSSRFVTSDGDTYPISGMTSVKMRTHSMEDGRTSGKKFLGWAMTIFGGFGVFGSVMQILAGGVVGGIVSLIIFGAMAYFGYPMTNQPPLVKYQVITSSSSGEVEALASEDRNEIQSVVNALNEAIVHRG